MAPTRCCWGGSPSPGGTSGRWTCAAGAALWRCCGTTPGTGDHARRWNLTRRQAHSAARRLRRTTLNISRRSARIYGSSARQGRSRGSMILQPATRPTLRRGRAAPTSAAPRPATPTAARRQTPWTAPAAPWLFLVEAQKGRKTGLRVEPDVLITSGAAMYGPRE